MGQKKTFTGSSKEDAEQKAEAWLVSEKKKRAKQKHYATNGSSTAGCAFKTGMGNCYRIRVTSWGFSQIGSPNVGGVMLVSRFTVV